MGLAVCMLPFCASAKTPEPTEVVHLPAATAGFPRAVNASPTALQVMERQSAGGENLNRYRRRITAVGLPLDVTLFSWKPFPMNNLVKKASDPALSHPYEGMWVTDDNRVRHQLLPNGRYDEARGTRESAYRGRYEVTGTHIEYWDDTGFTADGDFVNLDTLHHGGMILRRKR